MPEIMKILNKRERQQKQTKVQRGDANYSESVGAKWFCFAFKLSFLEPICKASLIFKSNLEFSSFFLEKWELYESKHVVVECRCLKIWDLLFSLICSSILVLKWH